MSSERGCGPAKAHPRAHANESFKRSWGRFVWSATFIGALFHWVLLFHTPDVDVDLLDDSAAVPDQLLRLINLTDLTAAPPAPEEFIVAPSLPTMEELKLDLEMDGALPLPEFDDFALETAPVLPQLRTVQDAWLDYRTYAPYVVRPEIRNREELRRSLQRGYQPIYEYSGDTGVVQVSFWVNEAGKIEKAEISKSSGSRSLDRLALRLSRVLQFRPAMMAGRPVRILVHMPITFRAA